MKQSSYTISSRVLTNPIKKHVGIYRFLMKGIFNAYVLLPFDKKLISILVMQMRTRHFLKVKISYLLQSPTSSGEVICVCNLLHVTTILKYILILLIFINHYILSIPQSKLFSWFPGFPQVWPEKLAKNYMRPKNNFFSA